jgi:restriction system protein
MDQNEVAVAFDIVLEEIEDVIEVLNNEGAQAFQSGKYDIAKDLIDKGSQMTAFREKVSDLRKEWTNIFANVARGTVRKRGRKVTAKLKRGLRTPEDAFREPILKAIVELGGSAPMAVVLEKVEQLMKGTLNAYDRQSVSSYPHQPRWRNTAQWTRNAMVREGLLSSDSERGIWEITDAGRRWLAAVK